MSTFSPDALPKWFQKLVTLVREKAISPDSDIYSGLGYLLNADAMEHGLFVIRFYPLPVMCDEDGPELFTVAPAFKLDISVICSFFDAIECLELSANDSSSETICGTYFKIRGTYAGHSVSVYIYAMPPSAEKPIRVVFTDGSSVPYEMFDMPDRLRVCDPPDDMVHDPDFDD